MKKPLFRVLLVVALVLVATPVLAQARSSVDLKVDGVGSVSAPLQLVLLMTLLSFLPAILVTMTSFTRIVIVFHFLRQALGTQEMPSNQILSGWRCSSRCSSWRRWRSASTTLAVQPAIAGHDRRRRGDDAGGAAAARVHAEADARDAISRCSWSSSKSPRPRDAADDLPMTVVIPAYVISELKTGFQMGFFLFVPFMLIDLVVSTTLLSMGMLQLPPAMISLPFKMLLFVMIDGWNAGRRLARQELRLRSACLKPSLSASPVRRSNWRSWSACRCCSPGLIAGVLVSMFQTVTSIQDSVLGVHPARAAIFVTFALTFPWMLRDDLRLRRPT